MRKSVVLSSYVSSSFSTTSSRIDSHPGPSYADDSGFSRQTLWGQVTALTVSRPLRILLIDDNRHGLDARRVLLEDLGYQIDTACCGEDGLTEFEKAAFDLVVTDYVMPGLRGSEVIKRIRTLNASVPIVMLSGYVEKLGLTKEQIGADMVLAKGPNEDRDLARSIARLVKKKPRSESGVRRAQKARGAAV